MSKARNSWKGFQSESNENEFYNPSNSINFPPPRSPLNTIPDPSQCHTEFQPLEHDSTDKLEASQRSKSLEKRFEASNTQSKRIGNVGINYGTPKVSSRGKAQSEPNSAQSTPARSLLRPPQYVAGKGGSSSRVSRRVSIANPESPVEIPQFELIEDPSFWNDHNVQVLIRIRPVSNTEMLSQGYGRCLRQDSPQTLVWLGHPEVRFTFDHIASESISQEKLFKVAGLPMVDNCMSGYNSCMFAYGQTGSGKTYTMMGEICHADGKLNEDCGITPRVFEYLFTRMKEEEEKRREERLKYSCRCSFLEIYNEQITDLLEPSSTNLQIREDSKKGVYVENLVEYNVRTVDDVLKLLLQGAANRKMAATHMNSESSRSHSVFTCVIESRWEKDSMPLFRFGRLNLVDLAGSERQKSSGADGDRLKEAANINKSLSTLSLVIMSLVDLAHGRHRHVPYRDSRLTFLLQDSLGGNSKTTIIANVTPSICSTNETLSTLKFAQRVKLIQNNAKVNEDASGGVTALHRQIHQLKGQLSFLMKHQNISSPLSQFVPSFQQSSLSDFPDRNNSSVEVKMYDGHDFPNCQKRKIKCLEASLVGALRREKLAETAAMRLQAEIEQLNRLAHQREEDAQRMKMILRFREEKIKRLDMLADGLVSADKYLMDENNALVEEIQLLKAKIDTHPELTRFATENIRLIEQLRLFQDFYEQGERESLLAEVSGLRGQLLEKLEAEENYGQPKFLSRRENQDNNIAKELEECKNLNSKLMREVDELQSKLREYMTCDRVAYESVVDDSFKVPKDFKENSQVKNTSLESNSGDEIISYNQALDEVEENTNEQKMGDTLKELMELRVLMEAMECEQVSLIEELQFVRQENHRLMGILSNENKAERPDMLKFDNRTERGDSENQNPNLVRDRNKDTITMDLQVKLNTMTKDLEEAQLLGNKYLKDHASLLSKDHQTELIREEVEMETAKTILHLQEEVSALQSELQENLFSMDEENKRLRNTLEAKEDEVKAVHAEWERASLELTSFLLDGSKSLRDASGQIESIACSFPHVNVWIGEHVEKAAKASIEKEETILLLQKSLENAQKMVLQMEQKLNSLKGATMALTEIQELENDANSKEAIQLTTMLNDKINMIDLLQNKLMCKEDEITEEVNHRNNHIHTPEIPSQDDHKFQNDEKNQQQILHQIIVELGETNDRLKSIRACISTILNLCGSPAEDLVEVDGWTTDSSTSGSSPSAGNSYSESSSSRFYELPGKVAEQIMDLEFEGDLFFSSSQESDKSRRFVQKLSENETALLFLRKEFKTAYDAFVKLNVEFAALFSEKEIVDCSRRAFRDGINTREAEAGCCNTREFVADEKVGRDSSVFTKFKEAHATMKEADFMLNALLKANDNAKQLTGVWKQAGEDLVVEKTSLIEEIEQLKSSIRVRDEENEILKDQIHCSLFEILNSLPAIEVSFLQMQKDMEDTCKAVYSDALTTAKDILHYICFLRSSLEDIFTETMEKGFASFVLHQCHVGEYNYRLRSFQEGLVNHLGKSSIGVNDDPINENLELQKELERKETLMKGLLFDLSLLQESASTTKDIKDETEGLNAALSQIQLELQMKTSQLDDLLVKHRRLECHLADTETALFRSNSDLEQAKETSDVSLDQNAELRVLLEDLYLKKSETEEQLEEQREVVKSLEKEILRTTSSADKKLISSIKCIEDHLRRVTCDRDQLHEQIDSLQDKLDMAYALADENEAIAVEARQESEASKIYAEQKEEEVKILEHSVEELECTINVLEKKVFEMEDELERHRTVRESLELELQALRQRLLTVENFTENWDSEYSNGQQSTENQLSRILHDRSLELYKAQKQIRFLEVESAEQAKEIKQYQEYISELLLHTEAQASQYQQKYKTLEAMVHEVKTDPQNLASTAPTLDRIERSSTRARGSSSPFRCITNLVQQMNMEKDQELSIAKLRIEELEALAASRQKEICTLNTRLAAVESMTHDVNRDLLGVKLDMTNYANLIDEYQLQKLVVEAHHQKQDSIAMEQEILDLRRQVDVLIEERDRFISEVNKRETAIIATQMTVEQLQEHQLLTAQNDMLKKDKTNLQRRVSELDDMVKKLFGTQNTQSRIPQQINSLSRAGSSGADFGRRLAHSEKLLSRVNDELSQYHKSEGSRPHDKLDRRHNEIKFRKQKTQFG